MPYKFPSRKPVPVTEPLDSTQERQPGGGYAWQASYRDRLRRLLLLGGVDQFYLSEDESLDDALRLLEEAHDNFATTMSILYEVAQGNTALKNSPSLLALAVLLKGSPNTSEEARRYNLSELHRLFPAVVRTGAHFLELMSYLKALRAPASHGRRKILVQYYDRSDDASLVYDMLKYRNRCGWTQRDALRMLHVAPRSRTQEVLFDFIVNKTIDPAERCSGALHLLGAYRDLNRPETTVEDAVSIIHRDRAVREIIPGELLKAPEVQLALIPYMPATALLRSLTLHARKGLHAPGSEGEALTEQRLDAINVTLSRLHPYSVLLATLAYASERSPERNATIDILKALGSTRAQAAGLEWNASVKILKALDRLCERAFQYAQERDSGSRYAIVVDHSGSMEGVYLDKGNVLNSRQASLAYAYALSRIKGSRALLYTVGESIRMLPARFAAASTVREALDTVNPILEATNLSLAVQRLLDERMQVDALILITDAQANTGEHFAYLWGEYRNRISPDAAAFIVCTAPYETSLIPPHGNIGMYNVAGLSPDLVSIVDAITAGV